MRGTRPQILEHNSAVSAPRPRAEQLVSRATGRVARESRSDERDRPPVHQAAVLRHPKGSRNFLRQPQTRSATDAAAGVGCCSLQAADKPPCSRAQDIPVFTAKSGHYAAEPGLGKRHHLHPDAARLPLSDGCHGSLQPQRSLLAIVEHADRRVLHRGPGGCSRPSQTRDLQHGSGSPVHGDSLHEPIDREWHLRVDGRAVDNVFVERLWRTVTYEEVYLREYTDGWHAEQSLRAYFDFYCNERKHQALKYRTPAEVYLAA